MGLSFSVVAFGLTGGVLLFLFRTSRPRFLFALLPAVVGGILSIASSWRLVSLVERFGDRAAGFGFFGGYFLGGAVGAIAGLLLAQNFPVSTDR